MGNYHGDVVVVRWMDNSVLTVTSTDHKVASVDLASRYSTAKLQKIKVARPNLIAIYNTYMGGTDLMDANVNNYRILIRGGGRYNYERLGTDAQIRKKNFAPRIPA